MGRVQPIQDGAQILFGFRRRDAAQHVVAAQLHNHRIGMIGQRPVQPRQPARAGIARNTRIGDHRIDPAFLQRRLKLHGEFGARRQAIALGQAGAQRENLDRRGDSLPRSRQDQKQNYAKQCLEFARHRHFIRVGMNNPPPALILQDVSLTLKSLAGPVDILSGVSLSIAAGETVALTGPSGSGKSSLLMVAAGLEKPTSGRVVLTGTDITAKGDDALARFRLGRVGVVFQSFHLIPTMTALENVAVPLELMGVTDALDRATRELRAVGLIERTEHYPGQLSGGEQQRVALARAMAPGPQILFADEPTGNLDGATGAGIADLLFALNAERGATLFLVTHEESLARRCGRVLRMADGKIATDDGGATHAS